MKDVRTMMAEAIAAGKIKELPDGTFLVNAGCFENCVFDRRSLESLFKALTWAAQTDDD